MIPILTVDTETTGFNAKTDDTIEIGAALFDWETKKPVCLQSDIIQSDITLSEEVKRVTSIEQWMLKKPFAVPLKTAMFRLSRLMQMAKYVVAHNAPFDMRFLKAASDKSGIILPERIIIDTMRDLPIPHYIKTRALNYLLTDHNLSNPHKHRAVFDCLSTFDLMACYELEEILASQKSELITVQALVEYEDNDLARDRGFRFNKIEKKWLLEIKRNQFEKMELPFETKIDFEIPF